MEHRFESQRNPWKVDGGRRQTGHEKYKNVDGGGQMDERPALHCGSGIRSNQMKYDFLLK